VPFQSIQTQSNQLGLSTILGGCGVQLEELTHLYSSFANGGHIRPMHFLATDTSTYQKRLISEAAAYFLTEVLSKLERPDLPNNISHSKHLPKVAWKTGTSYGRRDAWSIGYNANYTIGVWVGNFSGKGVPELIGAKIAPPLLFRLFNTIYYSADKDWIAPQDSLHYRWVCSETGALAASFCEDQVMDLYHPLISSNTRCNHLTSVWINLPEGYSYCRSCLPEAGYQKAWYTNHSPDMLAYYEQENIQYETVPPHNPQCERIFTDWKPKITSPTNQLEYLLDYKDNAKLKLSCNVANDVTTIYWYVNDVFYQSATVLEHIFFEPKAGHNKISCVDDKGRQESIGILVRFL